MARRHIGNHGRQGQHHWVSEYTTANVGLRAEAFIVCMASIATPDAIVFGSPMVETRQAKKKPELAPLNKRPALTAA